MCKHLLALGVLAAITLATPVQAEEQAGMPAMTDEAMIASAGAVRVLAVDPHRAPGEAPKWHPEDATIVTAGMDLHIATTRAGLARTVHDARAPIAATAVPA